MLTSLNSIFQSSTRRACWRGKKKGKKFSRNVDHPLDLSLQRKEEDDGSDGEGLGFKPIRGRFHEFDKRSSTRAISFLIERRDAFFRAREGKEEGGEGRFTLHVAQGTVMGTVRWNETALAGASWLRCLRWLFDETVLPDHALSIKFIRWFIEW